MTCITDKNAFLDINECRHVMKEILERLQKVCVFVCLATMKIELAIVKNSNMCILKKVK